MKTTLRFRAATLLAMFALGLVARAQTYVNPGETLQVAQPPPQPWNVDNLIVNTGGTLALNVGGAGEFTDADVQTVATISNDVGGFQGGSFLGLDTSHAAGGTFTLSAALADNIAYYWYNTIGLVKLGSGTLVLSGANTYTGGTYVNAGTLALSGAGTLGDAYGQVTVSSGGTLDLGGQTTSVGTLIIDGGTIQNGTIQSGYYDARSGTVSAVLGGYSGLLKSGDGTLTLSGANTYIGTTEINGGTVVVTGAGTLGAAGSNLFIWNAATLDISGATGPLTVGRFDVSDGSVNLGSGTLKVGGTATSDSASVGYISGTGGSLVKEGTQTLTLFGTNTYTGGTTVNAGTLLFANTGALPSSGTLSVASGATAGFKVGGSGQFTSTQLDALLAGSGFAAGSNLGLYADVGNGNTYTYAGNITNAGGGARALGLVVLPSSSILALSGTNTYSGGTTVQGTLSLSADNQIGDTSGGLTFNGGTLRTTASFATARSVALAGSGVFNLANGTTLTLNGAITGSGQLIKGGIGSNTNNTLVLTAGNTYTGGTTINQGTLTLSGAGTLGSGNVTVYTNATLDLGGSSQSVDNAYISGGVIQNGTLSANHFIASSYGTVTAGLSGSGDLTVNNGSGLNFYLDGYNAFTGNTTINQGTVVLRNPYALTSSTLVYNSSGGSVAFGASLGSATLGGLSGDKNLALVNTAATPQSVSLTVGDNNASATYSGVLSGAGSFVKSGTGTLTLSGTNTYSGGTSVGAGTLLVNNSSGSGTGNGVVNVSSGATLGGSGFIGGEAIIASGGHIAPGNSPGVLTFTNGLTLQAGAVLDFQLGTSSDRIDVTGGVLSGPGSGTVTLNLANAGGFTPATYVLFDFTGATTASFDVADFQLGSTIAGYDYNLSLVGSTLELTATVSAIPEPSTYAALAGLGALGWVCVRRRVAV